MLDFVLIRVDNRLVHGQILEAWVPWVKAARIIVVDDEVSGDFFRETVIRMAVPREIELSVYAVEEFSMSPEAIAGGRKKTIVLFSKIHDAVRAYKSGFKFLALNIGNVYNDKGRIICSSSICLTDQDFGDIRFLAESGVSVELRCVPRDKPLLFQDVLKKTA